MVSWFMDLGVSAIVINPQGDGVSKNWRTRENIL